jgi:hypothetical protein
MSEESLPYEITIDRLHEQLDKRTKELNRAKEVIMHLRKALAYADVIGAK